MAARKSKVVWILSKYGWEYSEPIRVFSDRKIAEQTRDSMTASNGDNTILGFCVTRSHLIYEE